MLSMNPAMATLPRDLSPPCAPSLRQNRSSEEIPANRWPVAIMGVPFDHLTTDQAIERIDAMIAARRPHYVVTANVDFLVQAHRDVELRRILLEADLMLCDGTPLLWASRWLGNPLPERVAGSDLAPALLRSAAEKGHRVFLLGAAEGVAAAAAERIGAQYPKLKVVGHYAPPFSALLEMDHAEIVRRVQAAKPDLLLVSFGCPKQEKWIAMHHRSLGVPVAIGVGATLDFLAGRIPRAPDWMRRTGTEWLYRLALEPKRLYRRYADDLRTFFPTLARQALWLRARGAKWGGPPTSAHSASGWQTIRAGADLTIASLQAHAPFWRDAQKQVAPCLLDLTDTRHLDATGVAFLVRWRKALLDHGQHLVLLAPHRSVQRVLKGMKLADHFLVAPDPAEAERMAATRFAPSTERCEGEMRLMGWCGEVTAANAETVWEMTVEHLRTFAARRVTLVGIDLTQLRFIDSSGAALMLRLKQQSATLGLQILFCHPQPNIRNVLRLTQLDQLLLEGGQ